MTARLEAIADDAAGYAHRGYAASLAQFGVPVFLPRSRGWILRRRIEGSEHSDAMGPYPLFLCRDWSRLGDDLSDLALELVSVVVVTDPFAGLDESALTTAFDQVTRFKDHFVAELDQAPELFVGRSHRYHARRSLRSVVVDVCEHPGDHLQDWLRLHANLSRRHGISGIRAFSAHAFDEQLKIPGLVMFRARAGGEIVGFDLWYVQGDVAYAHLAAYSELGYRLRASYATKWTMLHYFWDRVRWVNLAGMSGTAPKESDGLAAFKRGWSTGTKTTYLCERILQPDVYTALAEDRNAQATPWAPAYRAGEFA